MSLQDDYFDLSDFLKDDEVHLEKFNRIWEAFCDLEKDQDRLCAIVSSFRRMVELTFEDRSEQAGN